MLIRRTNRSRYKETRNNFEFVNSRFLKSSDASNRKLSFLDLLHQIITPYSMSSRFLETISAYLGISRSSHFIVIHSVTHYAENACNSRLRHNDDPLCEKRVSCQNQNIDKWLLLQFFRVSVYPRKAIHSKLGPRLKPFRLMHFPS